MNFKIKKRLFLKILINYCLIFIVPFILFDVINYININKVSEKQDNAFDVQNLIYEKNSLDNNLLNVKKALEQVANRKWIEEYLYDDESVLDSWSKNSLTINTAIKDLQNIKHSMEGIERIGVFFKGPGLVIDNTYAFDPVEYYKRIYKVEEIEAGKWFSLMDGFNNFGVLSATGNVKLNNRPVKGITFYKTIPPNYMESKGLIFCLVKKELINSVVNPSDLDNHSYGVIMDENSKVIAVSGNSPDDIPLLKYHDFTGIDYKSFNKTGSFIYYSSFISYLPWKLIFIKSGKHFYEYFDIPSQLILLTILIFIIGILISFVLSNLNFKLFEKLFDFMNLTFESITTGSSIKNIKSGYAAIKDIIEDLHNKDLLLQSSIESNRVDLVKNFLHCVISNADRNKTFQDVFEEFQKAILSQHTPFIMVANTYSGLSPAIRTKIFYAFNYFLQKRSFLYSMASDYDFSGAVVYLILFNKQQEASSEWIGQLNDYIDKLEKKFNAEIYLVLEEPCQSVDSIRDSYKKAISNIKCQMLLGRSNSIQFGNQDYKKAYGILPVSTEATIIKLLKAGEFEKIVDILKNIPQTESCENTTLNFYPADILFYELLSVIYKFIEDEKPDIQVDLPDLTQVESFEGILSVIREICRKRNTIGMHIKNARTNKDVKNEILAFIDDNYLDHGMCLKLIQDKFNISFSLITKIMKECKGYGFLEYLNIKRIEHARKLLDVPSISISKVRELSGFNDDGTFIRTFKKYENTTPGEYRQNASRMNKERI